MYFYDSQVANNIWVCENQTATPWEGDILAYKESLKKRVLKDDKSLTK